MRWNELTRRQLTDLLPEALVVVPVGATEQHGPHLPTGTDALLVSTVVERATEGEFSRPLLVTPTLAIGASDHHFPFGGTLSYSTETMTATLLDVCRSVAAGGGHRVVFVNGHGGNQGPCTTAAATASTRYGVAVAYTDYWSLLPAQSSPPELPGHAGRFETSLVLAVRPELVGERERREPPEPLWPGGGVNIHSRQVWERIDGYTDQPADADAEAGASWLAAIVEVLRDRLTHLARTL